MSTTIKARKPSLADKLNAQSEATKGESLLGKVGKALQITKKK